MENIRKHVDIKLVSKERIILSSYKVYHRTFVGYRNEKDSYTHKYTCLFGAVNTRTENFFMIMYNQHILKKQNCVICIQAVSLYT